MPRDLPVWRPDAPRVGTGVLAVRQGCGVTPATRAQMSDALDLVNAYIDVRAAHDEYVGRLNESSPKLLEEILRLHQAWLSAASHADELLEVFVARYGATR